MPDFDDIDLHQSSAPSPDGSPDRFDEEGRPSRSKWILLALVLLLLGIGLGYIALRRPAPEQVAAPVAAPVPTPAPQVSRLEGDKIDLPPLGETDALVRTLVAKLSSHPKVLAWLATSGLIETFTVVTLNISEGQTPVSHLRALRPAAKFRARTTKDGVFLDTMSYRRYDDYAAAVDGLDATGTARLYLTLKPRIMDAYRNLGHPEGDFDPVLERAIAMLSPVPRVDTDIALKEKVLSYQMLDPNLEDLFPAQKQLLRMGPRSTGLVQEKLKQIAALLGLHPEQVRIDP